MPLIGLIAVLSLLATYGAISPLLAAPLYRPMLFHPHKLPADFEAPTLDGIAGEDVHFGSDQKLDLHGWFFASPNAHFVVLISHGNGGNISVRPRLIESLLECGASVFIYDYSGYGKSSGSPDLANIALASLSAYNYLVGKRGYDAKQVILYGESLGCAVSVYLADHARVAGVILQSGFSSLRSIALEKMPWLAIYPAWLFPQPSFDSVSTLPRLKVPVLVIHGGRDMLVPYHHGQELYAAANEPKYLLSLPEAQHSDIVELWQGEFEKALRSFLKALS